jgi:hypothetical protein
MKVQILVGDKVIATQLVSIEAMSVQPTFKAIKAMALKAALEDRTIRISESLLAEFRFFDPSGAQIYEDAASTALSSSARAG